MPQQDNAENYVPVCVQQLGVDGLSILVNDKGLVVIAGLNQLDGEPAVLEFSCIREDIDTLVQALNHMKEHMKTAAEWGVDDKNVKQPTHQAPEMPQ